VEEDAERGERAVRQIDADALLANTFKNDISFNAFKSLVKRQPTVSGWIHVKEQLPETVERSEDGMTFRLSEPVLGYNAKTGKYEVVMYEDDGNVKGFTRQDGDWFPVTHWMKIVKPEAV
jgi:hypothetical protein